MSELHARVKDLAKQLSDHSTADHKTQLMTPSDDLYVKTLPEDIATPEAIAVYKRFQEHHTDLAAAAPLAVHHHALPLAKKHSDLKSLSFELPMIGKDKLEADWQRSTQVPNRLADGTTDGTKEKFGAVSVKFVNYAAGNRGALALVKKMVSDESREALEKVSS
jgi:hypothetical protein